MKLKLILSFFVAAFFLSSCSKRIYFTQSIRENLMKHHVSVQKVQFFNSKKIILKRDLTSEETKVARGTIRLENGRYVELIVIPKNTPGVVEDSARNSLKIAFENGKNRALNFVLNEKKRYQITPQVWTDGYGQVAYDTLIYFMEPSSEKAMLLVKKDDIYNFQKKVHTVKGKQIQK